MKTLVGWRRKTDESGYLESIAHYYCKNDSDPAADVISLCEKFYAFRKELVFPGPGMYFCDPCEQKALVLNRGEAMSDETIVNVISRMTMSLDVRVGEPPEEALRMALEHLFIGLARYIKDTDISSKQWFPLVFPMEMMLVSETHHWDFRIVAKLKNAYADKEEDDGDERPETDHELD